MGLSFLPPYGCQSNRTASVAALRMKAREHSEAVLQSANLLGAGSTTGPGAGPGVGLGQSTVSAGGSDSSPNSGTSKITSLRRTPDKHLHCQKEGPDKKWRNLGCCCFFFFFLIGGHILDEGFIIKHWMLAASFLRALTYPGQDGVKCNPLLCILCVCICQTKYSIVIFPLLVHFYTWFLTLVCSVWVYVGTWCCNLRGGMTFEHAVWQKKTPWLSMWTFSQIHFDVWLVYCKVRWWQTFCIVSRYMPCWNVNVLMWNNICKIISRTELYIKWFVMFYDMIRVTLIHADVMTTDTSLVITSVRPW